VSQAIAHGLASQIEPVRRTISITITINIAIAIAIASLMEDGTVGAGRSLRWARSEADLARVG
jgi:hypothetical protein